MSNSIAIHQPKESINAAIRALQDVLSSTYGLLLVTHNYHWNVEGKNFIPLHKLFEDNYNELFEAVDEIAERIRALGYYALPFEGGDIMDVSKMTSNALNKETHADERANRMINNLIALNQSVVEKCQFAKKPSQESDDDESVDLMVRRIIVHQKTLWMLNSIAK
jgi:starvation-inducible DNA-binding protein